MIKRTLLLIAIVALVAPCVMRAQTKDMWDYVTSFRTTTGRQQNIASDGQYIYTSTYSKAPGNNPPVNSMFYKYDFDGNLLGDKAASVVFDCAKLKSAVPGFCATTRFDQGVRRAISYLREHPEACVEDSEFDAWCDQVIEAMEQTKGNLQKFH